MYILNATLEEATENVEPGWGTFTEQLFLQGQSGCSEGPKNTLDLTVKLRVCSRDHCYAIAGSVLQGVLHEHLILFQF